jgi:hypothetical protein
MIVKRWIGFFLILLVTGAIIAGLGWFLWRTVAMSRRWRSPPSR